VASDISEQLRTEIARRANHQCEYCLIHEDDAGFSHEVDHILSRKHGGSSTTDNLAYACVLCNRYKGADVASVDARTGKLFRLYNPRQDRWSDHFRLEDQFIRPRTEIGSVTVRLLQLNAAERLAERRILQALGRYRRY
jgi:5-methylcytosine-specific restriction endonuclease McrA